MKRQFLINAVFGSLMVTAGVALTGCGPEDGQALNVASAAPAAKVGREVCTDEIITHTRDPKDSKQIGGTVAGAIIGGVIGNKIDKGNDTAGTIAGAAAGGYAGNQIQESAQKNNTYQETKRTCRMVYD